MDAHYFLLFCLLLQISLLKGQKRHFAYFKEPKTWLQAKETCSKCGGKLVNWDENVSEVVSNNDIQNTLVWIGNYTQQYSSTAEKGCVSTETFTYNIIYHNNPQFCSRSCAAGQMFALKGNNCYCIDIERNRLQHMCDTESDDCNAGCVKDHVKVYAFDDVYVCNFDEVACTNTRYGEEKDGLSWKRSFSNATDGIGNIGRKKGHFLLLQYPTTTARNKATLAIRLNLPEIYFCMSFEYYMNNGGSLEIALYSEKNEKYIEWKKYGNKRHMWYSSALDIKGKKNLTIEFLGSLESNNIVGRSSKVAIDNIKLKPGNCNKEKRMDCNFNDALCEWDEWPSLTLKKKEDTNDYFLQNPYERGTFYLRSSDIYPHILSDFCLRFKYIIFSGLEQSTLEVQVHPNKIRRFDTSNNNTWITASITFNSQKHSNVILNWSTRNTYVGIDDISVRSGQCETENLLSIKQDLDGWQVDKNLNVEVKNSEGKTEYLFIRSFYGYDSKETVYAIRSPTTAILQTTMFCFKFIYWSFYTHTSLRIGIETDNTIRYFPYRVDPDKALINTMNFEATNAYQLVIEVTKDTDWEASWNLDLMVTAGICQKDANKDTNDATMGPMCPVMNVVDNFRFSLVYCVQLKQLPYICQFDERNLNSTETVCKSAAFLNDSTSSLEAITLQTTESFIVSSESSKKQQSTSDRNEFSIKQLPSNVSKMAEQTNEKTEMVAIAISGILSAILIALLILVFWLVIKLKRTRSTLEEKETNNTGSLQNRSYEMEAIGTSLVTTNTTNNTDYELASPVNTETKQGRNIIKGYNESEQNYPKSNYQNFNKFTPKQTHEDQVYQETEEGDYDHLGESAERRRDLYNEGDNLYDHAQTIKLKDNGIYDKTISGNSDLSSDRESDIYDHTK